MIDIAPLGIEDVNALDDADFVATFGHVYEDSPQLAVAAWRQRPFADRAALAAAFAKAADALDEEAVLVLLRAHPELGQRGPMAAASTDEQRNAGLADADDGAVAAIRAGSADYRNRFGFPFIIAVRGLDRRAVSAALTVRLEHDEATERAEAFRQVQRIASLRIEQVVR